MKEGKEGYQNPLGYQPVGKLLLKFALPSVMSMLVNAIYNIVDQIFIGQGVGYQGNAATTIAFPVVTIILAVGTLLGVGGSAYASIKLGEKKDQEAEKTLGNVFVLLIISGIAISILGLVFLDPLLVLFGVTDNTLEYSRQYTSILLIGAPFNLLGVGLSNLARADGSPVVSMLSILAGALLNVVLDPIYIFVFGWGVTGAAIATITSQLISAVILIFYFTKKSRMRLRRSTFKLDGNICMQTIALGISSCIIQVANTVMQIVMNNSLVYYGNQTEVTGDVALSAMGIVLKVNMILVSICIGIGAGSQPILGFNRGANQPRRVRQTYLRAVSAATIVAAVGWLICLLFPAQILSIFGSDSESFTAFAVKAMQIAMCGIFVVGIQIVSTNYFQGTGQPLKATVLSSMRQIILLIPLILILPLFFGLDGILYAFPAADIGSAVVAVIFVAFEMRRLGRWIASQEDTEKIAPDGKIEKFPANQ